MWVTRRSTRARQRILSACFRSIATAHRRISLSSLAATGVGVSRDDVEDRAGGSPISFKERKICGRRWQHFFRIMRKADRRLRESPRNIAGRRQRQSDGDRACALECGAVAVDQAFFQGPQNTQRKRAEGVRPELTGARRLRHIPRQQSAEDAGCCVGAI